MLIIKFNNSNSNNSLINTSILFFCVCYLGEQSPYIKKCIKKKFRQDREGMEAHLKMTDMITEKVK